MAASLIHRPELFLMDEPFEGVDAVGARLMKDILLDQVRHGATIFLTSHVLEIVERLCTHVGIVNHGELIANGSLEELRAGVHTQADSADSTARLTLEEIFIRVIGKEEGVGNQHSEQELSWLG